MMVYGLSTSPGYRLQRDPTAFGLRGDRALQFPAMVPLWFLPCDATGNTSSSSPPSMCLCAAAPRQLLDRSTSARVVTIVHGAREVVGRSAPSGIRALSFLARPRRTRGRRRGTQSGKRPGSRARITSSSDARRRQVPGPGVVAESFSASLGERCWPARARSRLRGSRQARERLSEAPGHEVGDGMAPCVARGPSSAAPPGAGGGYIEKGVAEEPSASGRAPCACRTGEASSSWARLSSDVSPSDARPGGEFVRCGHPR